MNVVCEIIIAKFLGGTGTPLRNRVKPGKIKRKKIILRAAGVV
jgi:hypothetical protein